MGRFTVNLPDIGEGVAEGEVIEWLKNPGDSVDQDEPVVVVMTDKATVELPAPHPGVIAKIYYNPGDKALVSKPLYDIETNVTFEEKKELAVKTSKKVDKPSKKSDSVLALPKVRHLADTLGAPLDDITPTGAHGEVTVSDVKASLARSNAPIPTHLPDDSEAPIIGIRSLMAKKMAQSKQYIPHFSYFEQADATRLVQVRQNVKKAAANEGINATYMPFLIRALSLTLSKFPTLNSSVDLKKNSLIIHQHHNIGIAITTPNGLIVPVLKDVQDLRLEDIIRQFDILKKKALSNSLSSVDMKQATVTISNYGVLGGGGRWATPIINPPEVAILAVARIQKQPVAKNDKVVVRDILNLSWSFDHRIIDGQLAADASNFFATLITNPAPLL